MSEQNWQAMRPIASKTNSLLPGVYFCIPCKLLCTYGWLDNTHYLVVKARVAAVEAQIRALYNQDHGQCSISDIVICYHTR